MSGSRTAQRVGVGVTIGVLSAALAVLAGVAIYSAFAPRPATANPLHGVSFYVDPDSSAVRAARDDRAVQPIADEPSAIWLLPESHPTNEVGGYVSGIVADARRAGSWPVFVVYGIPDRDCANASTGPLGGQSAGGAADDAAYRAWVHAISGALDARSVVILEPDALGLAPQCDNVDARVAELRSAISQLAPTGATVYVDAGHSSWLPVDTVVRLLRAVGMDDVRGFSTNVSNFETTADERAYDEKIAQALHAAGSSGSHYVIDTSRNGNGPTADQAWCNPPGRLLGERPRVVEDGTGLDATLWIKNPGESDGQCNGAPPAGQWWPAGARALISGGE